MKAITRIVSIILVTLMLAGALSLFAACNNRIEESQSTSSSNVTSETTVKESQSTSSETSEVTTESTAAVESDTTETTSQGVGVVTEPETSESESKSEPETEPEIEGMAPSVTLTDLSFFEEIFFKIDPEKEDYINDDYDKYPRGQNRTSLLSRSTASYGIIKDSKEKVLADSYYSGAGEALNSPDAGMGILLYNTILYKIANPQEQVSIAFISRDISISAAVCVIPQSRYYGYMRSLEGEEIDYDENGFIRISFMLVEAAKMGIKVSVVAHDGEESDEGGPEENFKAYFVQALEQDCYKKYADGKKVSDNMSFTALNWSEEQSLRMRALTVSHYVDRFGVSFKNAVFFSGDSLDAVDEKGHCGKARSGVAITGHNEIYNATVNFIDLVADYSDADGFAKLKEIVDARNTAQSKLIAEGKEAKIPQKEQILWLGNAEDAIFKLCFLCGEGGIGSASALYSAELDALAASAKEYPDEQRIFAANFESYRGSVELYRALNEKLKAAFVDGANSVNRLEIGAKEFENDIFSALKIGENVGYFKIKSDDAPDSTETVMSYVKNGVRRYVSVIPSYEFEDAEARSVTSMITITETDEVGDRFYLGIGLHSSEGCIVEEGRRFNTDSIVYQTLPLGTIPQTFEAVFEINEGDNTGNGSYGYLFSNFNNWTSQVTYEILKNGIPRVTFWKNEFVPDETREKGDHYKITSIKFKFDQVDVRSYSDVHLTIVHDRANQVVHCYVNGELKQSLKQSEVMSETQILEGVPPIQEFAPTNTFVVGGSWTGSNGQHFGGLLKSLAIWSDIRDAEEIASDVKNSVDVTDAELLAAYDFTASDELAKDLSANQNDLVEDVLWQDIDEIDPVEDYAFSFAIIGDIQVLSEHYFKDHYKGDTTPEIADPYDDKYVDEDVDPKDNKIEAIQSIINWIIGNKDEHKIAQVVTLGDLTQQSYTAEWDYIKDQFYRLYGVVPFTLVPGNHDRRDPAAKALDEYGNEIWPDELRKNAYYHKVFNDEIYRSQFDGNMFDWDMANTYKAFQVGEIKYLLVTLDYGASDEMLAWAGDIVDQYPDHRVIVVTHAYLYRDGTTVDAYDTYPATRIDGGSNDGDDIWEKFISKHENIELVISGHDPWDHIIYTKTEGENGNVVNQLLIDPQGMDAYMTHGTGMIAMLYFSEDGNTVTVRYFSTVNNRYGSVKSQFTFNMGE